MLLGEGLIIAGFALYFVLIVEIETKWKKERTLKRRR